MARQPKLVACLTLVLLLMPTAAAASDRSFSSVVRHIKSNYNAKQQGFFGLTSFARLMVKMIKPAGVKNFKVVMLRDVDKAMFPGEKAFAASMDSLVHPSWRPVIRFSERRKNKVTYVYVQEEKRDVKFLAVTMQKREAFVVQFKFSPDRLSAFLENPSIIGISLASDRNAGAPERDAGSTN